MLAFGQANQSIGIHTTGVAVAYAVLKVQSVFTNPGAGTINALIAGEAYELIIDAADLDQVGAITFFLLDGGGAVVGVYHDTVVAAFPAPPNTYADALLDRADSVEIGLTPRELLRLAGAALGGVLVQTSPGVWQFRGAGVATPRMTAAIPGDGSRPAITLSL